MNLWAGFENASADNAQQIIQQVKCLTFFFFFNFYFIICLVKLV